MGAGGDEFGDGVGESRVRVDVEDGDGVAALFHATFGEDDGDKVHACGLKERHGGGGCEETDVGGRNVPYDIGAVVDYGDRGEAFVGHEDQSLGEGCIGAGGESCN